MERWTILFVLAGAVALAGCFPKAGAAPGPLAPEVAEAAKARYADAPPTAEELEQGRQLFVKSCDGCHGLPDIAAYPEQKWPATAKRMAAKAGLKDAEAELLARFIVVSRGTAASAAK